MIKTNIKSILNCQPVMQKMLEEAYSVKTSFAVLRLAKALNEELQTFNAEKKKIIEKYGSINQETSQYDIVDTESANKEFDALLNIELELNVNKIPLTEDIKLTAQELSALEDFIEMVE